MDYYLTEGDNVPYDYVVVYSPDDIDPAYIVPPRQARYGVDYDDTYKPRYVPPSSDYYVNRYPRYDTSRKLSELDLDVPPRKSFNRGYQLEYPVTYEATTSTRYPRYDTTSSYLDLAASRRPSSARDFKLQYPVTYEDDDFSYSDFGRPVYPSRRTPDYSDSLNKYPDLWEGEDDKFKPRASTLPRKKKVTIDPDIKMMTLYKTPVEEKKPDNELYLDKMHHILSAYTCIGVPPEPSNIIGNVFIGTSANAENNDLLKRKGFTHLLNCGAKQKFLARNRRRGKQQHPGEEAGVKYYEELYLDDSEEADLRVHMSRAHGFIDQAQNHGGFILVYDSGVSRSGAIVISYLIKSGFPLLQAVRMVKNKRRVALCNEGFMKQLVEYARHMDMLDPNLKSIRAPKFGGPRDKYRLMTAHLPTFM